MTTDDLRFKIGDVTYNTSSIEDISLRDVMVFNRQAADMGLDLTWVDVERIAQEIQDAVEEAKSQGKSPQEAATHPDALLMFGVTVWISRRMAGESVTLDQATDVPLTSIELIEARQAPKDHMPKKRKAAAKKRPKGSALAAVPPEGEPPTTPPTSSEESVSA